MSCRSELFGLLARHLAIAGQYSGGLCGSSWGRVSVGFDCFPAYFVSPTALYSFTQLPRYVAHLVSFAPLSACFLNASNSMPLQSGWLSDASPPLACSPSCWFHAIRRLILSSHRTRLALPSYRRPIPSLGRSADGVAVPITPPLHAPPIV